MSLQLPGRDIWVKTTDKDGKSSTSHHRMWDVGLFLQLVHMRLLEPA